MESVTSSVLATRGNIRIKQTRHGLMLYNIHDQYIGRSFDYYGEFSHSETILFEQIIKPGMRILDIGANIGAHTIYFAEAVGPTGQVLAFEPQRVIHQMLYANCALNEINNVKAIQVGVGSKNGHAFIPPVQYDKTGNFGGLSLEQQGSDKIMVIPIDSLGLDQCHFIKLDVEGMEEDVLVGAENTIAAHKPTLYIENDRREKSASLIERCWSMGYTLYWHLPPLYNPENFYKNPDNVFPGTVSLNMLCLPKEHSGAISGANEITDANEWPIAS